MRRLEERAPDEIGDDMKIVADDFDSAIDESGGAAADLLGGDVSGLASIAFRRLHSRELVPSRRRVRTLELRHANLRSSRVLTP